MEPPGSPNVSSFFDDASARSSAAGSAADAVLVKYADIGRCCFWRPRTDYYCASPCAPSRHPEAGTSPRTERSSSHFTMAHHTFNRFRAIKKYYKRNHANISPQNFVEHIFGISVTFGPRSVSKLSVGEDTFGVSVTFGPRSVSKSSIMAR